MLMMVFRAKALRPFPYSADGITSRTVVPGEVFDIQPHLLPGLLAQELVEQSDEDPTPPAALVELQQRAFDPRLAAGITPTPGGGFSTEATEVKDEHLQPVREAVAQQDPGLAAASVEQPGNPPPTDDRKTPPHPLGTVVDADDRAARDEAVQATREGQPLTEPRFAEADEASQVTGKPVQEVLAGDREAQEAPPEGGEEKPANPDAAKGGETAKAEARADAPGGGSSDRPAAGEGYATKDEKPARSSARAKK